MSLTKTWQMWGCRMIVYFKNDMAKLKDQCLLVLIFYCKRKINVVVAWPVLFF